MARRNENFHFTSSPTASLFDIWAEGSLRNSIKPAWEYLCKTLKSKYPSELTNVMKYSDEIFYLVLLIVEEYNLRKKSATITESFYELSRQCSSTNSSFMFRHAKAISLLSVVVLPYILEKLEHQYKQIREEMSINPQSVSPMKKRFMTTYPKLLSFAKWLKMANYICYVFNYTGYGNPILYLTRMQLKYGTNIPETNDVRYTDEKLYIRILSGISNLLSSMVTRLVPFMLHSLQFADMFYQKDLLTSVTSSLMSVNTPPAMPKAVSADVKLRPSDKQCPLCRQPHTNPTTISISGFVFCYTCIYQYVQMYECCPITYRPCDVNDLVNIRL